ncbi:GAF domain-containing protein [Psychrobacillus antarcticus]|uniref:GAF domain-containing protein n=1 Tax=Psychrobacillus antarcticus TaxID=2879115 RepID=UPI002407C594|nr:GAF domain-containing protein [Psychrobacillus antarcticus]
MYPLLEIKELTFSNPDGSLKNLSITLNQGEIHALVVKNTSDQALVMAALLKFQESKEIEGEILLSNVTLAKGKQSFRKENIQFMHAKTQVIENLSVTENMYMSSMPRFRPLPFINWYAAKKKAYRTLIEASFDINPSIRISELSRENKRIVYFLRLLSHDPKIMILQEPFEDLSESTITVFKDLIKRYVNNGGSILYLTKQWEDALMISNRISILSKGKILSEMSTEEATKNPAELVRRIENINLINKSIAEVEDKETQQLLEAVFKAAEFLTSEYELNDILQLLISEAIKALNAVNGSIILYDEKTNSIIDEFVINDSNIRFQRLNRSSIYNVAESKQVYWANSTHANFKTNFNNTADINSFICAPILSRELYGVIHLNFTELTTFTDKEIKYLKAFSRHAALAIEDTRLMGNSIMMKESHHRIKNNLQTVSNLILLQKNALLTNPDKTIDETLDNISSYVKSIAQVHDLMSKDHMGRSIINLKDLILSIVQLMNINPDITVSMELEDIFIPYNKATSIALIINELLMNSYKHAFNSNKTGSINVSNYKDNDQLVFSIQDDGIGLPKDFNVADSKGLGLSVIETILKSEFKGNLNFIGLEEGCQVEVKIPLQRLFS